MRALALAALLLMSVSCRTEQSVSTWAWADVDALMTTNIAVEDAPAVIVLREQRFLFQTLGYYGEARSEVHTHEILQLITEAGFERAQVRIFWPKKGKLLHLNARSIAPDGTVSVLDATELFASEVKIDDKNEVDARFFSFPRVEVGSFIELAYTTALDGLYASWDDRVTDELPILEYKIEIAVDDIAETDLRILNSDVKPSIELRDRMKHITFTMKDVPAAVHEPYAPSWKSREPWWIYRTVAYRYPNQLWYMNGGWDDVTRHMLKMFKGKGLEGTPAVEPGCADPVCVIAKASNMVRELTAFSDFDGAFSHRDVEEILAEKSATSADKALLLYSILKSAGIDARLAAVARRGTNEVPRKFPSLKWLNHTLVVAVFDGQALWIDPSCEHCGPGYLPSWDPIGEPALLVWAKDTARGKELVTDWWPVAGEPMKLENSEARTFTVTIEDDGDAKVVLEERRTGEPALFWRADTRNDDDDDRRKDARAAVLQLSRAALLDKWEAVSCQPAQGTCSRRLEATLPRFANQGSDAVRIALELLRPRVDLTSEEARKTDVVVMSPWRGSDELRITAPAGKKIDHAPAAWTASGPLVDVTVTSTQDGGVLVVKRETKLAAGRVAKAELAKIERVLDRGASLASSVVKVVDAN